MRFTVVSEPSHERVMAARPAGSENRSRWHGAARPLPVRLSVVSVSAQSSPGPRRVSWSCDSIDTSSITGSPVVAATPSEGAWTVTAGVAFSPTRLVASAPEPDATSEPETSSAAEASTAPATVCVRRRAAPVRRMTVARGQRMSSRGWARSSSRPRIAVVGTSRCRANCDEAVCSSRSASPRASPTVRPMSVIERVDRCVTTRSWRWVEVSLESASSVAATSGSRPLSRCQMRAVWRRRARPWAMPRT